MQKKFETPPNARRTPAFVLAVVCLMSGCVAEQSPSAPDEEILAILLSDFLDGASTNDAAMHDRFWAEDLIYTSSSGSRTTKQEIMAGMDAAAEPADGETPKYSAENVQIRVYDDAAVVAFRLVAQADDERLEYFNTGTFLKRDGAWRAVAWQATRIPEE